MKIILVLIAGTAIFSFFKIAGILLNKVSHKYPLLKRIFRVFPALQIITWTVFVFWANGVFFKDKIYYPPVVIGMALIVMALLTWFFFRDVVAGVVYRVQNDLNVGDSIQIGNISGQIKSMRLTHIEVAADNGLTIKVPNTRLSHDLVSGSTAPEGLEEFKIQLSIDKRLAIPEIEEKIKHEVANSPWCDYKNAPIIKLKGEDETAYFYDVVIYTMNQKHLRLVEKMLKSKLEKRID